MRVFRVSRVEKATRLLSSEASPAPSRLSELYGKCRTRPGHGTWHHSRTHQLLSPSAELLKFLSGPRAPSNAPVNTWHIRTVLGRLRRPSRLLPTSLVNSSPRTRSAPELIPERPEAPRANSRGPADACGRVRGSSAEAQYTLHWLADPKKVGSQLTHRCPTRYTTEH